MTPINTEMPVTQEILEKVTANQQLRQKVTAESHLWFFHTYFSHYVEYAPADFHKDMFRLTESPDITNLVIVAFRGSGKSTIMNTSYPIWSIIGHKKKFILIVGQTMDQAKQHIKNLKSELETNELLKADFGRFEEPNEEWRANSIYIPKYDAQITAVSVDQSIRGVRHKAYRPDLIICDDIEDTNSVRSQDGRNKLFKWVTSDLIPAGNKNTQLVMIGNLLHRDSVLMRFKDKLEDGEIDGEYREYRLLDDENNSGWPSKFPNQASIEKERRRVANDDAWNREYLLKMTSDTDIVIKNEWINYYDDGKIEALGAPRFRVLGIDLAISKKQSADYTAMVWMYVYEYGKDVKVYVLPNPVNERLTFEETMGKVQGEVVRVGAINNKRLFTLAVEQVGYQAAAVEVLENLKYPIKGITVGNQDKRARLSVVSSYVQSGKVLFPKQGCEQLINQLVGFGTERYDDLADAFSTALIALAPELRKRLGYWPLRDGGYQTIIFPN